MKLLGLRTLIQFFGMASTYFFRNFWQFQKKLVVPTYHIVICVLSFSVGRYIANKWGPKKPNLFLVLSLNNIGNLCDQEAIHNHTYHKIGMNIVQIQ
jgi:hypothetical protein